MSSLLQDVEAFLATHRETLSATAFGERAMNDRHLVRQLRNGRRLWPETEEKVRHFMVTYHPGADRDGPARPFDDQQAAA